MVRFGNTEMKPQQKADHLSNFFAKKEKKGNIMEFEVICSAWIGFGFARSAIETKGTARYVKSTLFGTSCGGT